MTAVNRIMVPLWLRAYVLTAVGDASREPDHRARVLEDRIARAMETGRKRAGLTVEEMVRRLRPVLRLPDAEQEKRVGQMWYDWRHRPRSIPAVALVEAAEMARTTVDALLSETSQPSSEGRVARLERRVVELEEQLETLRGGRSPQVSSGSPGETEEPDIDRLAADLEALRGDFVEFESQVIDFFARHGLDYRELMGPRAEQRLTRKTRPSSGHPTGS